MFRQLRSTWERRGSLLDKSSVTSDGLVMENIAVVILVGYEREKEDNDETRNATICSGTVCEEKQGEKHANVVHIRGASVGTVSSCDESWGYDTNGAGIDISKNDLGNKHNSYDESKYGGICRKTDNRTKRYTTIFPKKYEVTIKSLGLVFL